MYDTEDAIAAAAVDLNAGAKAKRKAKAAEAPLNTSAVTDDPPGEGFDAEGQHTLAIDRMANMVDELELDGKSLVYDVRDFLLDTIKARPKPWSGTSQAEQRDVAAACENAGTELVRKIVEAVAARGINPVRVLLTKVSMGGDIVITGKVKTNDEQEEDAAVTILHKAIGKHVMLTVASIDDYRGEGSEVPTDPDQPGFGFEGGDFEDD